MVRNRRNPKAFLFVAAIMVIAGGICLLASESYQHTTRNNALIIAIQHHDLSTAKSALDAGADPNAFSSIKLEDILPRFQEAIEYRTAFRYNSFPALKAAAAEGDTEICLLLLKRGANPNLSDNRGRTALHSAVFLGKTAAAEVLIQKGADVNASAASGERPLDNAVLGNRECVSLLLKHGAEVNHQMKNGKTALTWAASSSRGDSSILKCLIAAGADVNSTDIEGKTPLWYAIQRGNQDKALLLQKAGARRAP
jgi:ankyrin repeat protein